MKPLFTDDPAWIRDWELVGRIASGGMGTVFLARREGEFAAVKVIRPEILRESEARDRFRVEVEALGLVRSPYVIRLIDADPSAAVPWLAMAYEASTNLDVTIARSGPLERKHGLLFLAKLAKGVEALHEHGIIHRDLKPTNVLVTDDGPRIIDLGIVKTERAGMTGTYAPRTQQWASPEQIKANPEITPGTDVFNLGLVAAYCLSGKHPFGPGETPFELAELYVAIGRGEPQYLDVDDDIAEVLLQCFVDPRDRPTPGEVSQAFSHLARGHSLDAASGDFGSSVERVRSHTPTNPPATLATSRAPEHLANCYLVVPRSLAGQSPDATYNRLLGGLERAGFDVGFTEDQPSWWWDDAWFRLVTEPEAVGQSPRDLRGWLREVAGSLDLSWQAIDMGGRIVHCAHEWGGRLYASMGDDVHEERVHLVALESTPERAHGASEEIRERFPRHGKTWTEVEEQKLVDAFLEWTPLEKLIKDHGRSPSALCSRLEQQGVMMLLDS